MRTPAVLQGAYYLATGVWPLVSMRTFEAVTGPKRERWLVNTVGVLVGIVGGVLLGASASREPSPDARRLGVASAVGLTAIDVTYVARRRIPPVYLLDAVLEVLLVAVWLGAGRRASRGRAVSRRA